MRDATGEVKARGEAVRRTGAATSSGKRDGAENFRRICTAVFSLPHASTFLSLSFLDSDRKLTPPARPISSGTADCSYFSFAEKYRAPLVCTPFPLVAPSRTSSCSPDFNVQHASFFFAPFFIASALRSVINYLLPLFSHLLSLTLL